MVLFIPSLTIRKTINMHVSPVHLIIISILHYYQIFTAILNFSLIESKYNGLINVPQDEI